jgi:hypothetical protein
MTCHSDQRALLAEVSSARQSPGPQLWSARRPLSRTALTAGKTGVKTVVTDGAADPSLSTPEREP